MCWYFKQLSHVYNIRLTRASRQCIQIKSPLILRVIFSFSVRLSSVYVWTLLCKAENVSISCSCHWFAKDFISIMVVTHLFAFISYWLKFRLYLWSNQFMDCNYHNNCHHIAINSIQSISVFIMTGIILKHVFLPWIKVFLS